MPVTIGQSLQTGALRHCKLVAGKAGPNRKIRYVDTMEIPNISPWLKHDELLVTTGYVIKNDSQALLGLIRSLAEAGATGLAVKTRFQGEVDRLAIELADRLEIPVIEIPPEASFIDIITPLMKEILDIVGAVVAPDVSRYAKSPKDTIGASVLAFVVVVPTVMAIGVLTAQVAGTWDLVDIMLRIGWGLAALIVLLLAQWTSNDNNLYCSALGFAVVFKKMKNISSPSFPASSALFWR